MFRAVPTRLAALMILLLAAPIVRSQEITATPNKPTGVYAVGEAISWKIEVIGDGSAEVKQVSYTLKKGGLTVIKQGVIDLTDAKGSLETSLDEPGTILAELKAKISGKDVKNLAGAAIAPEKIPLSMPRPDDFDAFWKTKVDQLHAIPANPKIEAADSGKPNVEYFKIELDNINGTRVYGQLAKPKGEGKYPAMLIVQYAGVYGLKKDAVVRRASEGWLALNIMAHDLPFDQPDEFYKKAAAGALKDYTSIGADDREKSYFLRMYLGCYRAADYLADRPDWNGKVLLVTGTSQGGQQSLVTAGFHPKITAMAANVPAGCDVTGPKVGRAAGFPYFANQAMWKKNDKILEVGRYFDAANFAKNVTCPSLVALGLIDETCPPAGVFSAINQFQGPKEAMVMVYSDHQGRKNSQAAFWKRSEEMFRALQKGDPAPIGK